MTFEKTLMTAAAAILVLIPISANAASISFSGTSVNTGPPPVADPTCAPLPNRLNLGPGATAGLSNFGTYTFTQSHCTVGGVGPYSGGVFNWFFAQGDMLTGNYSGNITPSSVGNVLNNTIDFVVTSGTGRFLGGTGNINGLGTITFVTGMPPRADLVLNGTLNLPAVPEPATWLSMIIGFGAVGGSMRARRASGKAILA